MKLGVTLDILNQKATPAFYADTLANRPAAGFTGRVFISTDTLDLYRDTGTTWVLLSPSSTGTITGSGAAGQVTYFSAASSITGSNNLFWDSVNSHLGIQTITPDCALDVNHNGTFVAKFNNTSSANTLIGIYNADNPQWLIGSNNVANNLTFYDATNFPTLVATTTMKTDGTTYIGGQTTGSGRLNVYSATGDNGIQISGPTAPSLRIDNAPTGATKRIGLGIATAVNNFIQGAVDRDMCIFNGSTTASPMLFGIYDTTNVQEAARISAARNFLVGTSTDAGFKLDVNGAGRFTGVVYADNTIRVANGIIGTNSNNLLLSSYTTGGEISFWNNQLANRLMTLTGAGNLEIGGTGFVSPSGADKYIGLYGGQDCSLILEDAVQLWEVYVNDDFYINRNATNVLQLSRTTGTATFSSDVRINSANALNLYNSANNDYSSIVNTGSSGTANILFAGSTGNMTLSNAGNLLIGTTTDNGQKLRVSGTTLISDILSVGTLSNNNGLSTNTKLRVCGDGSTNAGASMGSCFAAAGSGSGYDTGISVNMGTSGATMLLMASINTSTGTSTNSAVYIVRFYFDGNNLPTTTYLGGSSDFVTFSVSGSNTLILTASNAGNRSYSWFFNKVEN